jgi:phage terminase small subunit
MAKLKNHKWERFAQEVARGTAAQEAYALAGFTPHNSNPYVYLKKPEIERRVDEIRAELAAVSEAATAKAVAEIVAERSVDEKELLNRLLDLAEIGHGRRTIKRKVIKDGEAVEREVTELDINAARQCYEAYGRQAYGMFIPRTKVESSVTTPDPEARRSAREAAAAALGEVLGKNDEPGTDTRSSADSIH